MKAIGLFAGPICIFAALATARAADVALLPEVEPVDYVRVCDVYGKGFYYIPGTQTCLSVGGYVRFQVNVAGSPAVNLEGDEYQVASRVRARLNFDAREETELGTLRGFVRLQATNTSGANNGIEMEQGYIQLGGLTAGYRDTLWTSTLGDGLLTDTELMVGDFHTNQINYTFTIGNLAATIGLEDDGSGDVVPDVHGRILYTDGWGGAYVSVLYDETFNAEDIARSYGSFSNVLVNGTRIAPVSLAGSIPTLLQDGGNGSFGVKGGLLLTDLVAPDSRLKFEGHYATDPSNYVAVPGLATVNSISANNPTALNATPGALPVYLEWAAGLGYAQRFGKLGVAIAGQYGETFDTRFLTLVNGQPGLVSSQGEYFTSVLDVGYQVTSNLASLAEVSYKNVDFGGAIGNTDQVLGFLRLQRNF